MGRVVHQLSPMISISSPIITFYQINHKLQSLSTNPNKCYKMHRSNTNIVLHLLSTSHYIACHLVESIMLIVKGLVLQL